MRPIVIDANIVFAAFIRDAATREIILDHELDLRTPSWLWDEVVTRYPWIEQKTRLPRPALDELLHQIRHRITQIPDSLVQAKKAEALRRVGSDNKKDAPYVAATLAVNGILWTHDTQLIRRTHVETITTKDLLENGPP